MNGWLPFEWIAAARFLREGRMQSIAIVLGVSNGVGCQHGNRHFEGQHAVK